MYFVCIHQKWTVYSKMFSSGSGVFKSGRQICNTKRNAHSKGWLAGATAYFLAWKLSSLPFLTIYSQRLNGATVPFMMLPPGSECKKSSEDETESNDLGLFRSQSWRCMAVLRVSANGNFIHVVCAIPGVGFVLAQISLEHFYMPKFKTLNPPPFYTILCHRICWKGRGKCLLTHLSFDCYTISISAFMLQGNYLSCFSFLFSFSFIFRQSNPQQFSHFPFRHCPCFLALCFPRLHMSQWFFFKYCCICRGRFLWLLIVISSYSFSWAKHSIPTFAYSW